jgi:hypothetical protein
MVTKYYIVHESGFAMVQLSQTSEALKAITVLFCGVSTVIVGLSWFGVDGQGMGLAFTTSTTCTLMTNTKIAVRIVVAKSFFGI